MLLWRMYASSAIIMGAAGGQARAIMHRRAIMRRRDIAIIGTIITAVITTIIATAITAGDRQKP